MSLFKETTARELVVNIARAATQSSNYPAAWALWKGWADELVPPGQWESPAAAEFVRQVKRNLQSMTALRRV